MKYILMIALLSMLFITGCTTYTESGYYVRTEPVVVYNTPPVIINRTPVYRYYDYPHYNHYYRNMEHHPHGYGRSR